MLSWRLAVACALLTAAAVWMGGGGKEREEEVHLEGHAEERWRGVREAFRANLEEGWEREGAAFTVYYQGHKVVDVWGGFADRSAARLWQRDTMTVMFSSTKAVAAVCVAVLVDRGRMDYDDLVSKHWPAFASAGKANITVQWVLSHMSGLPYADSPITREDAADPARIAEIFEKQVPHWPAGSQIGYHALTYGWLVDQIVRRVDKKGRGVGAFYREEIRDKHGLDVHISLPLEKTHRVARIAGPSPWNFLQEYFHCPSCINVKRYLHHLWTNGPMKKTFDNSRWIGLIRPITVNDPELYRVEQAAVLGIGEARELARMFELLRQGKIVSERTVARMFTPYFQSEDWVTGPNVARGQGLMMSVVTHNGRNRTLIGHSGYGGQNVRVDRDSGLTLAYLSNGLKVGFGDTARTYQRLLAAVFDALDSK